MKKLKHLLILLLGFSIGGIGCNKIEKADPAIGFLLNQLASAIDGGCANVSKSGSTYIARLIPIPKSFCNNDTFFPEATATEFADNFVNKLKDKLKSYDNATTQCTTVVNTVITPNETSIKTGLQNSYNSYKGSSPTAKYIGIDDAKGVFRTKSNLLSSYGAFGTNYDNLYILPANYYQQVALLANYISILANIYVNAYFGSCSPSDSNPPCNTIRPLLETCIKNGLAKEAYEISKSYNIYATLYSNITLQNGSPSSITYGMQYLGGLNLQNTVSGYTFVSNTLCSYGSSANDHDKCNGLDEQF